MPSEQSPSNNTSPARKGSSEKGQHPPITSGVRGLLGLPMRERGVLSTAPLTTPPRGPHYGQPPLPASEGNDESFREVALDEGLIEEGGRAGTDTPERPISALHTYETGARSDFPRSLLRDDASLSRAILENPADTRSTATTMPAEQREQTSFVIPGVSTHRTEFTALAHTVDTTKVTQPEESQDPSPDKAAPLHAPVSLPHAHKTAMFEVDFLSRLEHLVTEGAKVQHSAETQRTSMAALLPNPVEQMGAPNGEQGNSDVDRRLTQLQRMVNELAATVSAQAAHMRDERQAQGRERKPPPQRMVVVQRGEASSTTPRAFWERSRLGRFHLRTGR
jgi:hypothetical protein